MELVRPAADDVITIGTLQTIQWVATEDVAQVDVVMSHPDLGEQLLAGGIDNNGTHAWQVPLLHSDDSRGYRIRVEPIGTSPGLPGQAQQALEEHETVAVGSLAGFKWNGSEEEYYWVDLVTGDSATVGTVGDMEVWEYKGSAVFDAASGIAYVIASPDMDSSTWKVYQLDAATGALLGDVVIQGDKPSVININSQGELVGFRWNGSAEEFVVVDTDGGAVTVRGTVGDLESWTLEAVIDNDNDRLYLLGTNASNANSLYVLDPVTGSLVDQQPLGNPSDNIGINGLAFTSTGLIVGFRWSGTEEEVVHIDPSSGSITTVGTVGDLESWGAFSSINPTTDEVYVFGFDAAQQRKLYTVDAVGGALLYDIDVVDFPTTTVLVY